jgi:hypothetical protein
MTNSIDFETALAESLLLANSNSKNYIRLGEIAANVKTTYGGKTLNELAKRSGIPYASLRCYRAVYLAFKSDPVLLASSNFCFNLWRRTLIGRRSSRPILICLVRRRANLCVTTNAL